MHNPEDLGVLAAVLPAAASDTAPELETVPEPQPAYPLEKLKEMFRSSQDACDANNLLCIRDRDFYDGDQLSAAMRSELNLRGQPLIYINKIASGINGLLGIIDAVEGAPEAAPRNRDGKNAADVATKLLRFIRDKSLYRRVRKSSSKEFLLEGTAAIIVEGEPDSVTVKHILWRDFFYDPHSLLHDFSDARYLGIAKWLDADVVQRMYPEAYTRMGDPFDNTILGVFDAKGNLETKNPWIDMGPSRRRLRVIDMYYLDQYGAWQRCIFCERGVFWCGPSHYVDDEGQSICPIVAESFEIKQGGERYGAARHAIPPQTEINSRRSKLLHHVNHRQVEITDPAAAATDSATASREAAKADGVIPYGYKAVSAPDLAQGQMLILEKSERDLDRMFPTPAVLARATGVNESGRARQILQQAGYTELARAIGRFTDLEHRVFKQMWFRARQFFSKQMDVRVTQDGRTPDFITINEPVIAPRIQSVVDPTTGRAVMQTVMAQVGTNQRVAEMDVDIELTTVPDVVTLRQEAWEAVLDTAKSLGLNPLSPEFRALIKFSPLPNAIDIYEELGEIAAEVAQQNAPAATAETQAAMLERHAHIAKNLAKADRDSATAEYERAQTLATATKTALESHQTVQAILATEHGLGQPQPLLPPQPQQPGPPLGQ
jgi:hypothetical protein